MGPQLGDRQRGDDRRRSRRIVLVDRRSGFDRRRPVARASPAAVYEASLVFLRDHPRVLFWLLAFANLFSALDLLLTMQLLGLGVTEANPVMDYFFESSMIQAAVVKTGVIAAASLAIWSLRRRRAALVTALFLTGLYGAVVLYELIALAHLT